MNANWFPKLVFIGSICLVLIVPMFRITALIAEREARQEMAAIEISRTWSGPQLLGGPVLTVPLAGPTLADGWWVGRAPASSAAASGGGRGKRLYLLPEDLAIEIDLVPEVRRRGIFETVVYTARVTVRGRFEAPDTERLGRAPEDFIWPDAGLVFGLSELRGLRESPRVSFAGEAAELEAGEGPGQLFGPAITAFDLDAGALAAGGAAEFELQMVVGGSRSLELLPLGRETRVALESSWPDPSFYGGFLPASHEIGEEGFTAEWSVPSFARGYPQAWIAGDEVDPEIREAVTFSAFGARLLLPVDFYQQVSRCTKYAPLFILLTFAVFFLFELLAGPRIHPVQYLMVGFAMCLFYLLLLAVAEHLGFGVAYLAAALATVGLIGVYSATVLGRRRRAAVLTAVLAVLYGVLYVLVQLETYTLLVGSVGLFCALALAMALTRRVDWYGLRPEAPDPASAPA